MFYCESVTTYYLVSKKYCTVVVFIKYMMLALTAEDAVMVVAFTSDVSWECIMYVTST